MNNRYGFEDNFISKLEMKRNVGFMRGSQRGNDNGPGSSAGNSSGNSNSSGNGGNRGGNSGYGGGRGLGQSQGRNAPGRGNNNRGGNNRPSRPGQQRQGSLPAGWTNRGSVNPNTGRRAGDAVAGLGSRGNAIVANRNRAQNAALSARGRRNQRNNALGGILGLAGLAAGGPVGLGIGLLGAGIGAFGTGKGKSTGRQLGNLADLASPIPGIGTALRAKGIADEDNARLAARGFTQGESDRRSGFAANRAFSSQKVVDRSQDVGNLEAGWARSVGIHNANQKSTATAFANEDAYQAERSKFSKAHHNSLAAARENERRSNIPGLVSTQQHEYNRNTGAYNKRTADTLLGGPQAPGFDPVAFAHSQNRSVATQGVTPDAVGPRGKLSTSDLSQLSRDSRQQYRRNIESNPIESPKSGIYTTGLDVASYATAGGLALQGVKFGLKQAGKAFGARSVAAANKSTAANFTAQTLAAPLSSGITLGRINAGRLAKGAPTLTRGVAHLQALRRGALHGDKALRSARHAKVASGLAKRAVGAGVVAGGAFGAKKSKGLGASPILAGITGAGLLAVPNPAEAAPRGRLDGTRNTTNPTALGSSVSAGRDVKGNFSPGAFQSPTSTPSTGAPSIGAPSIGAPSGIVSAPAPSAPQEQSVQIGGTGPNGGVIGQDAEGNLFEIVNGKKLLLPRPTQNPIQNPPANPTPPQTSGADSYYSRRRRYSGPFELFGRAG